MAKIEKPKKMKHHNVKDSLFEETKKSIHPMIIKSIGEQVETSMIDYGAYVIEKRAIPSGIDGLKPSQRRSLYTFKYSHKIGEYVKMARISGACIGLFDPHGDISINDAVANMIQQWKNNFPLIKGQGNWGSPAGDSVAAARYVEVMIPNDIEDLLFDNIDKDNVIPWIPNYDDTTVEPVLLPVKYPIHLINGTEGIAYSLACNIPSYNIQELTKLFIYLIDNNFWEESFHNNITSHKINILKIIQGPDLATHANVIFDDEKQQRASIFSHSFKFLMMSNFEINEKENSITITKIPFNVTTEKLKAEIIDASQEYKIVKKNKKDVKEKKSPQEVLNIKPSFPIEVIMDENNPSNIQIKLYFKNGINLNQEKMKLLQTSCVKTFVAKMRVINEEGIPKELSLFENIMLFLKFRQHVVYQSFLTDNKKIIHTILMLEGLILVLNDRTKFFNILKNSEKPKEDMLKTFKTLTQEQVDYIFELKVEKITKLAIGDVENNIEQLKLKRIEIENIIKNSKTIFKYIKEEYEMLLSKNKAIKATTRTSEIIFKDAMEELNNTSMEIERENISLLIMEDETIGIVPNSKFSLRNKQAKSKNQVINQSIYDINVNYIYEGTNLDSCFFITSRGRVFKEKILKFSENFQHIRSYFNLASNEDIIKIVKSNPTSKQNKTNFIFITNNSIQNIKIDLFEKVTNNAAKTAIKLKEDETLIEVLIYNPKEENNLYLIDKNNKYYKFNMIDFEESQNNQTRGSKYNFHGFNLDYAFVLNNTNIHKKILLINNKGETHIFNPQELETKKLKLTPSKLVDKKIYIINNIFEIEDNIENLNLVKIKENKELEDLIIDIDTIKKNKKMICELENIKKIIKI